MLSLSHYQYKTIKTLQTSVVYSKFLLLVLVSPAFEAKSSPPHSLLRSISKLLYSKVLMSLVPVLLSPCRSGNMLLLFQPHGRL